MIQKKERENWFQAHKKELAIAGITIGVGVLAVWGIKYGKELLAHPEAIEKRKKSFSKSTSKPVLDAAQNGIEKAVSSVQPIVEEFPKPFLPSHIIEDLTGTHMTATRLGSIVGCSNREINKRIVAAGLATKCLDGEYMRTTLGEQLGKDIWKVTKAGHSFSNIEWDTAILKIICTPEELELQSVKEALERDLLSA